MRVAQAAFQSHFPASNMSYKSNLLKRKLTRRESHDVDKGGPRRPPRSSAGNPFVLANHLVGLGCHQIGRWLSEGHVRGVDCMQVHLYSGHSRDQCDIFLQRCLESCSCGVGRGCNFLYVFRTLRCGDSISESKQW